MKNRILALVALLLTSCHPVHAQEQMLKTSAPARPAVIIGCLGTDSSSYGAFTATGASQMYNISNLSEVRVHVYGVGGTATGTVVDVQTCSTTAGPCFSVISGGITSPTAIDGTTFVGGTRVSVPRDNWVRIYVTWAAGTVSACISGWRDATKGF